MIRLSWNKAAALALSTLLSSAAWAADPTWIDVRSPAEYSEAHVAGAINIPHDQIAERIDEVSTDKDAPLYLYCRTGNRSGKAEAVLEGMGYRQVENFGGLDTAREKAAELTAE